MIVVKREEEEGRATASGGSPRKRPRADGEGASNERRVLWCGSDGRGDGCAMGW